MKLTQKQVARIQQLTDKHGRIGPSHVIADAKRKDSPLHALFQWDLKKAWIKYARLRAREIIGSVKVIVTTEERTLRTPCYVHDPAAEGENYRAVSSLRADPVMARESLIYTLEVAAGHLKRAYDLAQPLGLAGEIDALVEQVAGVQRLVKRAA